MKKNVRNALAISGLAIAIGTSGLTLTARASTSNNGNSLRFDRHQNPSKIIRSKKTDRSEMVKMKKNVINGIIISTSDDSITIKKGARSFTVSISPETRTLNRAWQTISVSDIKVGHKVKISGLFSNTNLNAKTIRNISL